MKISIIIPVYNENKTISDCLSSLLKQSYNDFEIIVVDDGSTDQTRQIILKFSVKLLIQSHQGPAIARNRGVGKSNGKILVFIDADMTFDQDFISDLVAPIINGNYKGTFSKNEFVSNLDNTWSKCWNLNQNLINNKMMPDNYPDEGMDFRAILKEEFLRVGGFDDTGYTDTWTLAKKLGYKPHVVVGAKYFHKNPNSLKEVYTQSKWASKRKYKLGLLGIIIATIRVSSPVSLVIGLYKAIKYQEPLFLVFKVIYDFAALLGILEMIFFKKLSK